MITKVDILKIKGFLNALDTHFNSCSRKLDDFKEESLKWFDEMNEIVKNDLTKQRNLAKKNNNRITEMSSLNIVNCSIQTRSRAAQEAKKMSQLPLTTLNSARSNDESPSQKRRIKKVLRKGESKKSKEDIPDGTNKSVFVIPQSKALVKDVLETPKPGKQAKKLLKDTVGDSKHIAVTKLRNNSSSSIVKESPKQLKSGGEEILVDLESQAAHLKSSTPKDCSLGKLSTLVDSSSPRRSKSETSLGKYGKHSNNISNEIKCNTSKEQSTRLRDKYSSVISAIGAVDNDNNISSNVLCSVKSSTPKEGVMEQTYALRSSLTRENRNFSNNGTVADENNQTVTSSPVVEMMSSTPKETLEKTYEMRSINLKSSPQDYATCTSNELEVSSGKLSLKRPAPTTPSTGRNSNQENEPYNKRSRKTRTKENQEDDETDESSDNRRVTRTKTKQEVQVEKLRVSGLTKKSLSKAKALRQSKPKIFDPQSTNQKLYDRIATHLHSVPSKRNSLKVLIRLPIVSKVLNSTSKAVSLLKCNENVMSARKCKNVPLESKKLITPCKKVEATEVVKSSAQKLKEDQMELKLKAMMEKEEEALIKRQLALKNKQKELKQKNEMKLQSAMKQRQKLESEKHNNILQSEKEKEAKRKMLLQERAVMLKEKTMQRKIIFQKKLAETEERRRLEEEARIAKIKEQEAEQQRLMLEKQKALELHEKRVQERLADQKAREKYEMKMKEAQQIREKMMAAKIAQAAKMQSASKTAEKNGKQWNYKSRNENDLGLEDENSDEDSDREDRPVNNRNIPEWAKRVKEKKCPVIYDITEAMITEYMPCSSKTPDIRQMFKMTPSKKILRTSSAIWDTPTT